MMNQCIDEWINRLNEKQSLRVFSLSLSLSLLVQDPIEQKNARFIHLCVCMVC